VEQLAASYPLVAAALVLIGLLGGVFKKAYDWIQAEGAKQRLASEAALGAQKVEIEAALKAQEERLTGSFNARILILETHIKELEGVRRTTIAECGNGLATDDPQAMRACFQRILAAAG